MLVLTFQIGAERLALDVRRITEVVPRVTLQPVAGAPGWLAGVFVYRGQVVPVLDLHRLAGAGNCPPLLSSRIILVPLPTEEGGHVGLQATQVADIQNIGEARGLPFDLGQAGPADLGPVLVHEGKTLRLLDLDRLLGGTLGQQSALLPPGGT